jgi:phosphoadenosine phosphosulfate reductase
MIMISGRPVPLVHLKAKPFGNPESPRVRDAFLSRFPGDYRESLADYSAISPALGTDATEKAKDRIFFAAFAAFGSRHVSGIRADESRGRRKRMERWGLASVNALAPLGWWTAADVFGYLAVHDLPVHPSYAMLGGGRWRRDHLRVDELAGDRGAGIGRAEWEREYYGDVLRRLESRPA